MENQLTLNKFDRGKLTEDNQRLRDVNKELERRLNNQSSEFNMINDAYMNLEKEKRMLLERMNQADLRTEVTINEIKTEHQLQLRAEINRFMGEISNMK